MREPDHVEIRLSQPSDREAVCALLVGFGLPLDGLAAAELWVLESSDGAVVGAAGLETYGVQGLLRSVAVAKDLQGRGWGAFLVSFVVGEARKRRVQDLFLLTTTASGFFGKLGFREARRETVTGMVVDSVEFKSACPKTAVLMHLRLK